MSRILAIGLSLLVLGAAALGTAASAAPAPAPRPTFPADSFVLAGTDGYTISVSASPELFNLRSGRGYVSVTVSRGDESASYSVRGKVTEDSMSARLRRSRPRRSGASADRC